MPWTSTFPVLLWAIVFLPLTALFFLKKPADKLTTIVLLLDYALVGLFCALIINWAIVNYWLRLLIVIFFVVLSFRILREYQMFSSPFLPQKSTFSLALLGVALVILVGAAYLNFRALQSLKHQGEHVLLVFPVRNGLYVITNGGNGLEGLGMNNHVNPLYGPESKPDESMAYGLDIMRMGIRGGLTQGGRVARSYLRYVGYNDMVYSPCAGQVVYVEDGHPEVEVFAQGAPLGNYVVIQCAEYFITLGNLRNESIDVELGERVSFERFIGRVGNSGTPSIPHLHVHATKGGWQNGEGEPVPMLFPGLTAVNKFFVRNDLTISNKRGE
jgi:hypothetical protein